jgi:hypothetical protein
MDGKLFVVNCSGAKVAELVTLGYVERIRRVPGVGGIPTVAITYVPATGTGIQLRSVALVEYRARQLSVLWNHPTLDAAYFFGDPGGHYEERTSWRFFEGHTRIEATTMHTYSASTQGHPGFQLSDTASGPRCEAMYPAGKLTSAFHPKLP